MVKGWSNTARSGAPSARPRPSIPALDRPLEHLYSCVRPANRRHPCAPAVRQAIYSARITPRETPTLFGPARSTARGSRSELFPMVCQAGPRRDGPGRAAPGRTGLLLAATTAARPRPGGRSRCQILGRAWPARDSGVDRPGPRPAGPGSPPAAARYGPRHGPQQALPRHRKRPAAGDHEPATKRQGHGRSLAVTGGRGRSQEVADDPTKLRNLPGAG